MAALDAESFEPREREYWGIKLASPAIIERLALDYEMLVEQFLDFLREDERRAQQPIAEGA